MTLQSTKRLSRLARCLAVALLLTATAGNAIEVGIEPSGQLYVVQDGVLSPIDRYMEVAGFQYVGKLQIPGVSSPMQWQIYQGDEFLRSFVWDQLSPSERCVIGRTGQKYFVLRPDGSTISGPHGWAIVDDDGYAVSEMGGTVVSHGWDGRIMTLRRFSLATPYRGKYCAAWNSRSHFIVDERGRRVVNTKDDLANKAWNGFIFKINGSVYYFDGKKVKVDERYTDYIVASPSLIFLFERDRERRVWTLVDSEFTMLRKLPDAWEPSEIIDGSCLALNRATGAMALFYVETGELVPISDYRIGYGYLFAKTAEGWKRLR